MKRTRFPSGDGVKLNCRQCRAELRDYVYMFALDLEDPTGKIQVLLYHEDGVRYGSYFFLISG